VCRDARVARTTTLPASRWGYAGSRADQYAAGMVERDHDLYLQGTTGTSAERGAGRGNDQRIDGSVCDGRAQTSR
jgi:hypothetical protein